MKSIKLGLINIKKNFQNAKELKSAFITSIVGMCFNNLAFIVLWYYFSVAVGEINGWGPLDIIGMYAFSMSSYGIVFSFFSGINAIPSYISSGNFDKYLLTPKNLLIKVATSKISTSALGDLLFGLVCFIAYIFIGNLSLTQVLIGIVFILFSALITFSFTLISSTLSFYFMEGENISSGVFGLFISPSTYQGGAFNKILRVVFTFFIPALLVGTLPLEALKSVNVFDIIFVIGLTIGWFILSIIFFYKSLKKYESNNFFGFGG